MKKYLYILLTLCILSGCKKEKPTNALIEINNQKLYETDILYTNCLTAQDSADFKETYMRTWATDVLVQTQAERVANKATIDQLVENYRRALYTHEWEKYITENYMPKTVEDSLVMKLYNQEPDNYRLSESIIKGIFLITPFDAPKQDSVRYWFSHFKEDYLENIEKYAYHFGKGYELFLDTWTAENLLLSRLPISGEQWNKDLKINNLIYYTDSIFSYYVCVTDKHLHGERMPIEYAKQDIKRAILLQRQVEFIQQRRTQLYEDALNDGKIKRK